jgi:hypothetical protein
MSEAIWLFHSSSEEKSFAGASRATANSAPEDIRADTATKMPSNRDVSISKLQPGGTAVDLIHSTEPLTSEHNAPRFEEFRCRIFFRYKWGARSFRFPNPRAPAAYLQWLRIADYCGRGLGEQRPCIATKSGRPCPRRVRLDIRRWLLNVRFAPKADMAERVMSTRPRLRSPRRKTSPVPNGGPQPSRAPRRSRNEPLRAIATTDGMSRSVIICGPIATRAEILFARFDTNTSGPNPKRPKHEDVHSYT